MELRLQLVAVAATVGLLLIVLELVRRRKLLERYALLWLLSAVVLLGVAVWRGLLEQIAAALGIFYAPSALFVIAFGFILVLLLHFNRLRMREVPVRMLTRGGGRSSISSGKSAYYMIKVLLAIFVGLARARPVVEPGDDAPVAAAHGI